MAPSEVEIDSELAARAEEIAAAHGETVEAVVERLLRAYLEQAGERR
jgi:Arc/MetJ family transcription regulator